MFFSHSITEPRSYFLNLNGPVPIWASGRLRSPYFSSTCLAATRHHAEAMAAGKYGTGYFSVNCTVAASAASTEATSGLREAPHFGLLKSGLRMRSNDAFTSAEEKGCPSCHLTPRRRWNVYVLPSGEAVQRSARSPAILVGSSGSQCSSPL